MNNNILNILTAKFGIERSKNSENALLRGPINSSKSSSE